MKDNDPELRALQMNHEFNLVKNKVMAYWGNYLTNQNRLPNRTDFHKISIIPSILLFTIKIKYLT